MMIADGEYARARVIQTCADQGVPVLPGAEVRDAVGALLAWAPPAERKDAA